MLSFEGLKWFYESALLYEEFGNKEAWCYMWKFKPNPVHFLLMEKKRKTQFISFLSLVKLNEIKL